jgi:FAD/FMN-containing dehydrogenase
LNGKMDIRRSGREASYVELAPDATGRVYATRSTLRKDNSGYDLKHLFIGSEGTLGIITAASLRLHPPERHSATVLFAIDDRSRINPAADHLIAAGSLSALELMPSWAVALACAETVRCPMPMSGEAPWFLLAKFAGAAEVEEHAQTVAEAALEAELVVDAVIAQSGAQELQLWEIRDSFSELHRLLGQSYRFDLSVPLGRIPELIGTLESCLERIVPSTRAFAFGHLGDGNLHFSACQPPDSDPAAFRAKRNEIEAAVNAECWSLGGSISAEHGIGQLHLPELVHQKSAEELGMQRQIKALLDPHKLLNPGKLVPE